MAMNMVQFQSGLSMPDFMKRYGTEAKCRRTMFRSCWPKGFRCPACSARDHSKFHRGGQIYYQCSACRYQTTLVSGTLFQATKLPLATCFLAGYLRRHLGEAAYRFNRRFRLPELAPRLLHAMIVCKPCQERILRQASDFSG